MADRKNSGKLRFDLIPPEADRALAQILTMGVAKYSERNWETGDAKFALGCLASLKRHLNEWELGNLLDEESGYSHLKHVLWNAMAIQVLEERGVFANQGDTKTLQDELDVEINSLDTSVGSI